jgi:3-dehydroquinate synthase
LHIPRFAIESYFLGINQPISHGFAVAAGIQIECFISLKKNFLNKNEFDEITDFITRFFSRLTIPIDAFQQILINTKQDKKNSDGEVKMVLLKNIGESIVDISVEDELILNFSPPFDRSHSISGANADLEKFTFLACIYLK